MVDGHCMKCGEKREMKNPTAAKTKKGGDMIRGNCVKCDCKMVKFGKL